MAKIDLGNVMGPRGPRGTMIYYGTEITGTSHEGTVFSGSGIEEALIEDKYINTTTNDVYSCVTEGDPETAEWAWIGNIQGKQGIQGPAGPTGQVDVNTPVQYEEPESRQAMASGEPIGVLMGKIAKNFSDMTKVPYLTLENDLIAAKAGEGVLDAYQGKVLDEKITNIGNTLSEGILKKSDVINTLTSDETQKPLSAAQGKVLATKTTSLETSFSNARANLISALAKKGVTVASSATFDQAIAGVNQIEVQKKSVLTALQIGQNFRIVTINASAVSPSVSVTVSGSNLNIRVKYTLTANNGGKVMKERMLLIGYTNTARKTISSEYMSISPWGSVSTLGNGKVSPGDNDSCDFTLSVPADQLPVYYV